MGDEWWKVVLLKIWINMGLIEAQKQDTSSAEVTKLDVE